MTAKQVGKSQSSINTPTQPSAKPTPPHGQTVAAVVRKPLKLSDGTPLKQRDSVGASGSPVNRLEGATPVSQGRKQSARMSGINDEPDANGKLLCMNLYDESHSIRIKHRAHSS